MFICKTCGKEFENRYSYIGHTSSHSRNSTYRLNRSKEKTTKEVKIHKCKFCNVEFESGIKLGGHTSWCKLNPNYELHKINTGTSGKGRKTSQVTKNKLSISRKKYLDENPGQIPYLLNHSSKESYLEKVLRERLQTDDIKGWIQEYPLLRYSLDFAFIDQKINVEVDGGTHNLDSVIKKDNERDLKLSSLGWKVFRFTDNDIKHDLDNVIEKIKSLL